MKTNPKLKRFYQFLIHAIVIAAVFLLWTLIAFILVITTLIAFMPFFLF